MSSNSRIINVPSHIDEPPHLLMWSIDELAPLLLGLSVGMMMGKALICTVLGYLVTRMYRKFRDNSPDGYFLHILYHYGVFPLKGKTMINPFIKRLFP